MKNAYLRSNRVKRSGSPGQRKLLPTQPLRGCVKNAHLRSNRVKRSGSTGQRKLLCTQPLSTFLSSSLEKSAKREEAPCSRAYYKHSLLDVEGLRDVKLIKLQPLSRTLEMPRSKCSNLLRSDESARRIGLNSCCHIPRLSASSKR